MTTLYNKEVKRGKGYVIHHHVSGDLSHTYEVRSPEMVGGGYGWTLQGVGIPARTLAEAEKIGKMVAKYGYGHAYDMHNKKVMKEGYSFGFLADSKLAKELAPYAYGDYAKKIRKKYKLKEE